MADIVDHFQELKQDPACAGDLDVLLDLTTSDFLPETHQFDVVIAEIGVLRDKVRFGSFAVVAYNDAMFGMMRMFEVIASSHFRATRVFRAKAEAEAWLVSQRHASGPAQVSP